mmetsp:Transcript_87837/g.174362  ORF Transcript_87837/g.174362 Transcript_87837/m.174362 type:complete len:228 (-) Transcript_87837:4804-5487(-)
MCTPGRCLPQVIVVWALLWQVTCVHSITIKFKSLGINTTACCAHEVLPRLVVCRPRVATGRQSHSFGKVPMLISKAHRLCFQRHMFMSGVRFCGGLPFEHQSTKPGVYLHVQMTRCVHELDQLAEKWCAPITNIATSATIVLCFNPKHIAMFCRQRKQVGLHTKHFGHRFITSRCCDSSFWRVFQSVCPLLLIWPHMGNDLWSITTMLHGKFLALRRCWLGLCSRRH